jgi:hypothetical protein
VAALGLHSAYTGVYDPSRPLKKGRFEVNQHATLRQ